MREFINQGLVGAAVFLTVGLGVLGAALSRAGGLVGPDRGRVPRSVTTAPDGSRVQLGARYRNRR
jgi:hypothetical protein